MKINLMQGDCLERMKEIPDGFDIAKQRINEALK